jgi:DNA polymerase I-like protein with 3'-5' exonuclease and polymerase domains
MARVEPRTISLVKLFGKLNKLKRLDVPLYPDNRIRPSYWPFRTTTGRNGAKASRFLLLKDKWLRGFIQAPPGRALAQLDYKTQELYVLAMLSGDQTLLGDLEGDIYLRFAISLGLAPSDATKGSHGDIRDRMKPILLGSTYGMTPHGIASKTRFDLTRSREIHAGLKRRYRVAWGWLEDVIHHAYRTRRLVTPMGWPFFVGPGVEKGTLQNHMVQATAADIIHVTCALAQDVNVNVISTLHDSVIIESDSTRSAKSRKSSRPSCHRRPRS